MKSQFYHTSDARDAPLRIVALGDELSRAGRSADSPAVPDCLAGLFRNEGLAVEIENLSRPHATADDGGRQLRELAGAVDLAVVNFGLHESITSHQTAERRYHPVQLGRWLWRTVCKSPRDVAPSGSDEAPVNGSPIDVFRRSIRQIIEELRQRNPAVSIVLWAPYRPCDSADLRQLSLAASLTEYAITLEAVARQAGCYFLATDVLVSEVGLTNTADGESRERELRSRIADEIFYLAGDAAYWNRRSA